MNFKGLFQKRVVVVVAAAGGLAALIVAQRADRPEDSELAARERPHPAYLEQLKVDQTVARHRAQSDQQVPRTAALTNAEASALQPSVGGSWGEVIDWPLVPVTVANMPDGRLLTWSGGHEDRWGVISRNQNAVWDPLNGDLRAFESEGHNMFCAGVTMTTGGDVFAMGGLDRVTSTSQFDWRQQSWSSLPDAVGGRWYPTVVSMPNDNIYVGLGTSNNAPNTSEIWDPEEGWRMQSGINWSAMATGNFQSTSRGRSEWPLLQLAPNGKLFHSGPTADMHWIYPTAEGGVESTGLVVPNGRYTQNSASLYYDQGKLITIGGVAGGDYNDPEQWQAIDDVFLVDINGPSPQLSQAAPMNYKRAHHNAVVLPTGEVVAIGGLTSALYFSDEGAIYHPELWNPDTGQWRVMAPMSKPRNYHSTAILLPDGRVWTGGGGYNYGNTPVSQKNAQVWTPPYLYNEDGSLATRPTIEFGPLTAEVGAGIEIKTDSPITKASLVRMSATTHAIYTDVRFVSLEPQPLGNNRYRLVLPDNSNVMLPGYWMLFATNAQGVPSVSHVIKVREYDGLNERLENVARFSTATASSLFGGAASAQSVTDTVTEGDYGKQRFFISMLQAQPWLQLELPSTRMVERVKIYNRTDCCAERLKDVYLLGSDKPFASNDLATNLADSSVWSRHYVEAVGDSLEFDVGRDTRYLRVQLGGTDYLQLPEVEVYAQPEVMDTGASLRVTTLGPDHWKPVAFAESYNEPPVVIAGVPTRSGSTDPVTVRVRNVDEHGFEIQLDEWDYLDGVAGPEQVPVLALKPGVQYLGDSYAEAIQTKVSHEWKRVHFEGVFGPHNPAVVAQVVSAVDDSAVQLQMRNLSQRYVDLRLVEQEGADQRHTEELVNLVAVNNGVGSVGGLVLEAGPQYLTEMQSTIAFSETMKEPVLFASMVSNNDPDPVSLRLLSTQPKSFQIALQEETSADAEIAHGDDWLTWFALDVHSSVPVVDSVSSSPQVSGATASFTANVDGNGALTYGWNFGDGKTSTVYNNPSTTHSYAEPGLYMVTLTVTNSQGKSTQHSFTQLVHLPAASTLRAASSSTIQVLGSGSAQTTWVVNPDNDSISRFNNDGQRHRVAVGSKPWSVSANNNGSWLWVSNKGDDTIMAINTAQSLVRVTHQLPSGSQPHGIIWSHTENVIYVALEGLGEVWRLDASRLTKLGSFDAGPRPRHLALSADGNTLYVSRYITSAVPGESTTRPNVSPSTESNSGVVAVVNAKTMSSIKNVPIGYGTSAVTEHTGPGLPNYLGAMALSPDGRFGYVPSKQDNILGGLIRPGQPITHDQGVRAISSRVDLAQRQELPANRIEHDNASVASAAVYGPRGAYLFTALEGNRAVAVSDAYRGGELFRFNVGMAPQSLALSADGKSLWVHNFSERSLEQFDISAVIDENQMRVARRSRLQSVTSAEEKLQATVLKGKQLFYDAVDPRLANQTYMSCASCHNEGDHDGRIWDFSQFGEGLRNTTSLRGKGDAANGLFHWSGNFDEVQDFEGQIRAFAGLGLMSDREFSATSDPLGNPKTGRSADLDALSAYVNSLLQAPENPGANAVSAASGRALFEQKGCASCHRGNAMTDSADGARHNVGTLKASSGKRSGGTLDGLDTPTLVNLRETAPYLHDGSAATVAAAIAAHNTATLSGAEANALANYLLALPHTGAVVADSGLVNVAGDGSASASSTGYGSSPSLAIDGNTDGHWRSRSTTHSLYESQPWLQVDLAAVGHSLADLPEQLRRYSSIYSGDQPGEGHGRSQLDSVQGWSASGLSEYEWMELPIPGGLRAVGVRTKGRAGVPQWVTDYKISVRLPGGVLRELNGGEPLTGNSDSEAPVDHLLPIPADALAVRISPSEWNGWPSMRAGLLVEPLSAPESDYNPADSERIYSSVYANNPSGSGHARSQIGSPQAWSPATRENQWMSFKLPESLDVLGLKVQGRSDTTQWVTSMSIEALMADGVWLPLAAGQSLGANSDQTTVVEHRFGVPREASQLRIKPETYFGYPSLRAALITSERAALQESHSGDGAPIERIVLFNRTDCCAERLSDVHVFASVENMSGKSIDELRADNRVWHQFIPGRLAGRTQIDLNYKARYVRVQLEGTSWLSLAEVQVMRRQAAARSRSALSALVSMDSQRLLVGEEVSMPLAADASAVQGLQFSVRGLPDGLQADSETGRISGTVGSGGATDGIIHVSVSDGLTRKLISAPWSIEGDTAAADELQAGTSVSDTLATGEWRHYRYAGRLDDVRINAVLDQLDGDMDLYLQRDKAVAGDYRSEQSNVCQSIQSGAMSESCAVSVSQGIWYISVHAVQGGSFRLALQSGQIDNASSLLGDSQAVAAVIKAGDWHSFDFDVASSDQSLVAALNAVSGDVDLYLQYGDEPTEKLYACRSDQSGSIAENCSIDNPALGLWKIGVLAHEDASYSLSVRASDEAATTSKDPGGSKTAPISTASASSSAGGAFGVLLMLGLLGLRRVRGRRC